MIVHELSTLITDLLLAGFAGWLGWRLDCRCGHRVCATEWMARALWIIAAAALVGGTYHGFAANFGSTVASLWWKCTLLLTCLAAAALDLALVYELAAESQHDRWRMAVLLKFCVFAAACLVRPVFLVAIIAYGLTLVAWAVAAMVCRRGWSAWVLMGVGMSVVAAVVQQMRISPAEHFNHNDLYHAVQAVALFGFYRAGRLLVGGRREGTVPAVSSVH